MKDNKIAEQSYNEAIRCEEICEKLKNINECLRHVEDDSNYYQLALVERAKIFYDKKKFTKCLENLEWVLVKECTMQETQKFCIELRKKCLLELQDSVEEDANDLWSFFKLSYPANKNVPFVANCLEVKENETYGRHIITNKDLNPGDIVVVEEPFYKVLDSKTRHLRCAICLRQNMLNLFPCKKCCSSMFCSVKCQRSVIHQYECAIPLEDMDALDRSLLQRMIYQALDICGSIENIEQLISSQSVAKTMMDFDFNDPTNPMYDKNKILATTSLAEREPWRADAYSKFDNIANQLMTNSSDEKNFIRSFLVRCLKSMTVNFFHFLWTSTDKVTNKGFAICSLAAFFAHSCDPNVSKIDVDNKFVFVTQKPVNAGEQLFMCYDRYSFIYRTLEERQTYFSDIYKFNCLCAACSKNYPQYSNCDASDHTMIIDSIDIAKVRYRLNCEYIKNNIEKQYPTKEICSMMVENNSILHFVGNTINF